MRNDELDLAIEWAAREGWNPGERDAACFVEADPEGFLLACLDNEPVGCISAVRYDSTFGFLGFYIVNPAMRGRGYGMALWRAALTRLKGCTIGLDGVIAQQENYRKSGFVLAHRNIRFGGTVPLGGASDGRIHVVAPEFVGAVIEYDRSFFLAPREKFLRAWLGPKQHVAMALLVSNRVRGYGVLRACREGFKIGPLFADCLEGADVLFRSLARHASGAPLFLDCPEPNRSATELAIRHGLAPVFETARMYRGEPPKIPLPHIFGITSFELG